MNPGPARFPLVVGVIGISDQNVSDKALEAAKELVEKLRARSIRGVRVIPESASARLIKEADAIHEEAGDATESEPRTEIDVVEMSDLLLVFSTAKSTSGDKQESRSIAYARCVGRPVISIDAETGAVTGEVPSQLDIEQGWLPQLFHAAGLPFDADLETIKSKMSAVANKTAPMARVGGHWIVFLQGLALCVPLAWLTQRILGLPSLGIVAIAALSSAILLMTAIWWLRWRGMQKTWARSRLVAEAARSLLATADCPGTPAWRSLVLVPSLRPLRWLAKPSRKKIPLALWRESYIKNRIDGQAEYFQKKQAEAQKRRKQFSHWTTIVLDLVLAIAFFGAAMAFFGQRWLNESGGDYLQVLFGVGGVIFAASLVLIQALRDLQDLSRRTARFAQQQRFLEQARVRLANMPSEEAAAEVVEDTESELLAEVMEWYFHAETAEDFVRMGAAENKAQVSTPLRTTERGLAGKLIGRVAVGTGTAGLFALRVIFGRLPWILASLAAMIVWIAYNAGGYAPDSSQFGSKIHLCNSSEDEFNPSTEETARGCVVLVHGLYGGAVLDSGAEAWIKKCAREIEARMITEGIGKPAICLVDWKGAARPSQFFRLGFGTHNMLLADLAAIRPQAYRVGDYSAIQIAKFMNEGKIDRTKSIHLIGHSAGGFVIARIATRLTEMGFVKDNKHLRVTLLDTPVPDDPVLKELPALWPTEYYVTSSKVMETPFDAVKEVTGLDLRVRRPDYVKVLTELGEKPVLATGFWPSIRHWLWGWAIDFWQAHNSAYRWFELTVNNGPSYDPEGFNRSPLLEQKKVDTPR